MQKARINLSKIAPKEILIPGSKSFTNRALIIASLAKGKSVLVNPLLSDDTIYMINALKKIGIDIKEDENKNLTITGKGGKFIEPEKQLFMGNSGTAIRFCTALLTIAPFKSTITGDKRMQKRPIKDLVKALRNLGAKVETIKKNGFPPLRIKGNILQGGSIKISGKASSQYVSAILMIAPYAQKDIVINIEDDLTSKPYIDMTIEIMNNFGVKVENNSYKNFKVTSGQRYKNREYKIEADTSSASYFYALSALHNIDIPIKNINLNSVQPDIKFLDILKKMKDKNNPKKIKALGKINLNNMPDSVMIIAVMCAFANGKSVLTNIANLRIKESDRINALVTQLKKTGVDCKESADGIEINGDPEKLHGDILIETYSDHRMVMCMSILATKIPNLQILEPECTSKSYPNFFKDLESLGIEIKKEKIPNIYLTGMRGAGKSSIGKIIAKKIHYKFIDTDKEIEKQEKLPITEIIRRKNWFYFRKKEKYVIRHFAKQPETVISTGGGVILDNENVKTLKKHGEIVFLECDLIKLEARISKSTNRPPLTNKKSLKEELTKLWEQRKDKYLSSTDKIFDTGTNQSLEEKAESVIMLI